jgi:hypothetical protein
MPNGRRWPYPSSISRKSEPRLVMNPIFPVGTVFGLRRSGSTDGHTPGGRHGQASCYTEAELAMKERALAKLQDPDTATRRYCAPDSLIEFLNSL